jgi:hypothetical protein
MTKALLELALPILLGMELFLTMLYRMPMDMTCQQLSFLQY